MDYMERELGMMELCRKLRERCKQEAPNLDTLKTLFSENPKLAQLVADIDETITQWAFKEDQSRELALLQRELKMGAKHRDFARQSSRKSP